MAIRVSSAHYGWLSNVKKDGSLSWTKYKAGAALFPDKDQERIHDILWDKGISHDIEYSNVGWLDTNRPQRTSAAQESGCQTYAAFS